MPFTYNMLAMLNNSVFIVYDSNSSMPGGVYCTDSFSKLLSLLFNGTDSVASTNYAVIMAFSRSDMALLNLLICWRFMIAYAWNI